MTDEDLPVVGRDVLPGDYWLCSDAFHGTFLVEPDIPKVDGPKR
jgi:hypothetical protein